MSQIAYVYVTIKTDHINVISVNHCRAICVATGDIMYYFKGGKTIA